MGVSKAMTDVTHKSGALRVDKKMTTVLTEDE